MPTRDEALALLTGPGGPFEITEADVLGQHLRVYKNAPTSMRDVFAATAAYGDRRFVVYGDERYTYADVHDLVGRLANRLAAAGVSKGDRVAIGMRNYPEWVVAFWAVQVLGAVAVPLNAWWTGPELEYAISDSGAKVLVLDGERLERVAELLPTLAPDLVVVARHEGDVPDGIVRWADALAEATTAEWPEATIHPDDDATIMYTSGTTGFPKGAIGTQRNHITNITNTALGGALTGALAPPAASADEPAAPPPQMVALWTFPFFHIGGLTGLYIGTVFGAAMCTMYKWDPTEALDIVERERVTAIAGVPTVVRGLLEHPDAPNRDLTSLTGISSGGAPVPPDLIKRIESDFDRKVSPGNGYGLTETTSAVVSNGGAEYFAHPDSVGRPVPVCDVRIVDEEGNDVEPGGIGELWVRGPNNVRGYWNKPEATATSFTNGWFHTGDAARMDEEGLIYVVDRIKDVVIRGGENVYSAEVEAVIFEHPAVADVAIVGVPHPTYGEEVAAVVNVREGAAVTPAEIQEFVGARLARFKVPSIVVIRDEPLPRTATGKVLKRDLRTEIAG